MSQVKQVNTLQPTCPQRMVKLGGHEINFYTDQGHLYISAQAQLQPYPQKLTDRLIHFAQLCPDQLFVAKRDAQGAWIKLSYAETLDRAWHIAQALRQRSILSEQRPIVILSGNDLEHLCLSMAAMLAGIAYSAISPAYSLLSQDFSKLKHIFNLLTPGLVYASDDHAYAAAIAACAGEIEVVTPTGKIGLHPCTAFQQLLDTPIGDVKAHYAEIGADQIAKFLFTSGSTNMPKAVPTTQRMLCANQQMLVQTFPEFAHSKPVLVDWLSWHHTFGGSHNLGIALYNGGSLYIDDGKPLPGKFDETIRNLKEISPTIYLNVPKGWEELSNALEDDAALRDSFFAKVKTLFFAGAALSEAGWNRLDRIAQAHCGERIRIMSGLGMTETSPSCVFTTGPKVMAGFIGYPAPGCEVKLTAHADKLEFCVRGPNVMQHYWRLPAAQQQHIFDDEGYFRTGDAVRLVDPHDPTQGLMYDGRIAEDFKLSSGTFVNVGSLRNKVLLQGNQLIQDVCLTGSNLNSVGMLVFAKLEACAAYAQVNLHDLSTTQLLQQPKIQDWFKAFLIHLNQDASGSSTRINKLYLMTELPNLDAGEITDKGNLNQNRIQHRRAALIEELYSTSQLQPLIIRMSSA